MTRKPAEARAGFVFDLRPLITHNAREGGGGPFTPPHGVILAVLTVKGVTAFLKPQKDGTQLKGGVIAPLLFRSTRVNGGGVR